MYPATRICGCTWSLFAGGFQSLAKVVSVPLQLNYDATIGPLDQGVRWVLNVQPVVPFSIDENWNVISRTIVPLVAQDDIFLDSGSQSGLGDSLQTVYLSPRHPPASFKFAGKCSLTEIYLYYE